MSVQTNASPPVAPSFDLSGLRILVTGAGNGIGKETAKVCASLGAYVILADRRKGDVGGADAGTIYECDVADRAAVERLCESIGPIDVAVLSAGINPIVDWNSADWTEAFHTVMDVNVGGLVNVARCLLPGMQTRGSGRFVILGSIAAFTGGGIFSDTPPQYIISKGGVHAFVRWLARKAGPSIQVNGIAPGVVDTSINDPTAFVAPSGQIMPRMANVSEIAWPIAFLCSPAASYMTGAILDVNGGNYLR